MIIFAYSMSFSWINTFGVVFFFIDMLKKQSQCKAFI
jgi:hypothetical protein